MVETVRKSATAYLPYILVAVLVLASVLVWTCIISRSYENLLTVAFLDVGQGDAIFVETPNGNQLLLDGGNGRAVLRQLGSVMPVFDRSIDIVVASHPDMDHIGGLPEVLKRFTVGMFMDSGVDDGGDDLQALRFALEQAGLVSRAVSRGMRLDFGDGTILEFLFPDRDATFLEANTGSVVAKLTYGNTAFFFTGDSPVGIETYLATQYADVLKSNVLKLGHHGSKTSTSDVFLGYVNPEYAVISAGCENPYGHPDEEVLERLERFGVRKVTTCEEGTVVFESNGKKVVLKK